MDRSEKLINIWNGEFPDFSLAVDDLKKPHSMMGAYFQIFSRLGIDIDAILSPPPENEVDDHTMYYWDLLPIINMTRVINHVVSVLKQSDDMSYTITHFLQPDINTSHSILLLLVNWVAFNEKRLIDILPHVTELFGKREQVKSLEEKKNKLLGLLNEQAEEKGKRAERLERIDEDIEKFEEEVQQEKEALNFVRKELKVIQDENKQLELQLEQKKTHRAALLDEVARKKALRVYDADEIRATAEQSAQNVQEEEDKLNVLKDTLMQKESSLQNLQTIKPSLDQANTLLNEIMKLSENLNELESGDLEPDSQEGELEVLNTEVEELRSALAEIQTARAELSERRAEIQPKRLAQQTMARNALREAEEKDKRCREKSAQSLQRTQELKSMTVQFEQDKAARLSDLQKIESDFENEIKTFEQMLLKQAAEGEQQLRKKFLNKM